jgi:serine phosphatase RsbU (regulator of sigma subunit)
LIPFINKLEVVSKPRWRRTSPPKADKPQITSKDKARDDEKAQSRQRRSEQCISKKLATPNSGVRWGLETTSNHNQPLARASMILPGFISKIPMKISLPLLFTAPVICVVIFLSIITFSEAKNAANDLMAQNLVQIHEHIEERLDEFLNLPNHIQRINANLILEGWLDLQRLRAWQPTLLEQALTFKGLSSITWGGSDGRAVGVARYPEGYGFKFIIKDEQTDNNLEEFYCDIHGRMEKKPRDRLLWDPRNQPWYYSAVKAGKPSWTDPYARGYKGSSNKTLAMGYVQPLYNSNQQIIGVVNAELTLDDLSLFLEHQSVGRTGKAFLVDHRGRLAATSTGVPVTRTMNHPIIAIESADRDIALAAKHLENSFGSFKDIDARYQLKLKINRKPHLLMASPYEHETGLSWIIATLVPESDFLTEIQSGRQRSIKIGIIAVLITLLFGVIMGLISLWPMLDLVRFVQRVGKGDLNQRLKLEYSTEFVKLSREINAMTAGLRDRMHLRHSLALAQEVQQNLLPSDTPDIEGLDIAGHATYCDETGGDYFDFLEIAGLPETAVAIAVGDVVGHGVEAAMLMATARGSLRSQCRSPGTLADLLSHLNNQLVEDTSGDRFMTMMLMTIDARRQEMRWATAGHDRPIIYDPADDRFIDLTGNGVALGLYKGAIYEEHCFGDVKSGQIYVALTDGLFEAFNREGKMFGKERVRNLIRNSAKTPANEITKRINRELARFLGGRRPDDDLTFVIVKVL